MREENEISLDDFIDKILECSNMTERDLLRRVIAMEHAYNTAVTKAEIKEEDAEYAPFIVIIQAAKRLGWAIALPKGDEDINGVVMGTEEYFKKHLANFESPSDENLKV